MRMFHVNQWSERRRFDLAGLLSSILRAHLHAYDPVFSMTLRYLIRYVSGSLFFGFAKENLSYFCELFNLQQLCDLSTHLCAVFIKYFAAVKVFHPLYQISLSDCF